MTTKLPPLRRLTEKEQKLVLDNLGLAHAEARKVAWAMACRGRYYRPTFLIADQFHEELIDAGYIGLCIAAQRYDESIGSRFATYAHWWVKNFVGIASVHASVQIGPKSWYYRRFRASLFSELEQLNRDTDDDSKHVVQVWDSRNHAEKGDGDIPEDLLFLMKLTLDERKYRFLVWNVLEGRTMLDIGRDEGISKERVRQIVARGLDDLRKCDGFMQALHAQYNRRQELARHDFHRGVATFVA